MNPAGYMVSDRQYALLEYVRNGAPTSLTPMLETVGADFVAVACMAKLGFLTVRECGGLDPLVRITPLGEEVFRSRLNAELDPEFDPYAKEKTMNAEENDQAVPEAEDVTGKPNEEEQAPAAKPVLEPLYKTLLAEVKKESGRGHVVDEKAVYARVSQYGRAVAYINHPTTKSVRVEVPQPEGNGYDVVKAASDTDVPAVMTLVTARIALLKERKTAKQK